MPESDWTERANREAAALLAESANDFTTDQYNALVGIIAAAYRLGAHDGMVRAQEILGMHSVKS